MEIQPVPNAGHRLWQAQKAQGTGLCIGLDPHYDEKAGFGMEFYSKFVRQVLEAKIWKLLSLMGAPGDIDFTARFLSGVIGYFTAVVIATAKCGIRVFKPQAAFYEHFGLMAPFVLWQLVKFVKEKVKSPFLILDAKRGDIMTTQRPYYATYLSEEDRDVIPGMPGLFNFDAMTVTTWMGEDVLSPGLPWFQNGKGAIVVTRSSNPSGTTFQDAILQPNIDVSGLTEKQKAFSFSHEDFWAVWDSFRRELTAHEVMLYQTEKFSRKNGLNQDGVSPIFSVMGSTVKMSDSFRKLRPGGIALIPGFGAQGGEFDNIMPLAVQEGPLKGHIGILSSSREHNFPWHTKYGGAGDPTMVESEVPRVIDKFRQDERDAYARAGINYPF